MNTTRFTVTLPASRYAALKETAARQGKSMAEIVDQSLELYGVKSKASAMDLLDKARGRTAALDDEAAMQIAIREVAAHRARR
ncbi:hypothetical protein [uncultured Nevskia sp.]|uniref:hypothetical protein n=1 Tax=uncultured Nevskia sp. TaxID=228950 RepID=UPI0025DE2BF9|nr:hypothetical protein [uncultured Nevskia sp.]